MSMGNWPGKMLGAVLLQLSLCAGAVAGSVDTPPDDYVAIWKTLCPVAGYRHAFVGFDDLPGLIGVHADRPISIDPWTRIWTRTFDGQGRFTVRLEVSRFDQGRTSGWIAQVPLDKRMAFRSDLRIDLLAFRRQLALASVVTDLNLLGYEEIGTRSPKGGGIGEKTYLRRMFGDEVRVRYTEGVESAPSVAGITVIGYRFDGQAVAAGVARACR